jgi:maltose alpha-D-glucosyltransferase/alpha-amylase
VLKLFRRLEDGVNPEVEVGRFLGERTSFNQIAEVAGALEYRDGGAEPRTLAVLHEHVPNEGNAWKYTLDALDRFLEDALARSPADEPPLPSGSLVELAAQEAPELAQETIGSFLESARLLGQRTAEMHVALASVRDDERFAPEPFSRLYQRALSQSMRTATRRTFSALRRRAASLPDVEPVLGREHDLLERFRALLDPALSDTRIRTHGDYHLGQVLFTGKDFVVIDFEGEPGRPVGERRIKRSPLRDVAGMVRSLHYAAYTALFSALGGPARMTADATTAERWARFWYLWVASSFLRAYLDVARLQDFLPQDPEQVAAELQVFQLEKAVYELRYEADNRPDWLRVPVRGVLQLLEEGR